MSNPFRLQVIGFLPPFQTRCLSATFRAAIAAAIDKTFGGIDSRLRSSTRPIVANKTSA
jgi:hypothetical protein